MDMDAHQIANQNEATFIPHFLQWGDGDWLCNDADCAMQRHHARERGAPDYAMATQTRRIANWIRNYVT